MSPFFVLGRALVDAAELEERLAAGAVDRFIRAARADPSATLALGGRSLRASDLARPEGAPAFTPVGIGRPLSLEILTAYVGDAPARFRLGGRPDLLIASAVKSLATFDAAPRAIHQIVPRVEDHRVLTPSALRQGSPIVYYTRSVVDATVLCTFEFATDTLDPELVRQIADLLALAAGLPVFAPGASLLLAAGGVVRVGGELARVLLQSAPFLSADVTLRFDTPSVPADVARMIVACNPADEDELRDCELSVRTDPNAASRVVLVAKDSGLEYRGPAPYLIVSLDGRPRPELDAFTPTHASAAMLERFYGQEPSEHVARVLSDALVLYDDLVFRRKAEELRQRMESTTDRRSDEYLATKKLYDAYRANIRTDLFKLGEAP